MIRKILIIALLLGLLVSLFINKLDAKIMEIYIHSTSAIVNSNSIRVNVICENFIKVLDEKNLVIYIYGQGDAKINECLDVVKQNISKYNELSEKAINADIEFSKSLIGKHKFVDKIVEKYLIERISQKDELILVNSNLILRGVRLSELATIILALLAMIMIIWSRNINE